MTETQQLLAEYVGTASETAFRKLVERYINLVYATSLRLVDGDRHLAEDVTQTVFADLARAARTLSKDAKLGGWLHRHACFVAAKTMRGERRRRARERQVVEMNAAPDPATGKPSPAAQELDEAINHLREADRTAILLRFFEQRDFRGVGQGMGISEEAARKRVTRAVEKLHIRLSRRGVVLPAAALGAILTGEAVTSAPAGIAAGITTSALTGAVASGTTFAGIKFMTIAKIKPLLLSAAALAAITTPLVMQHRSEVGLRLENQALRQQMDQFAQLQADNDLLSNQLAQARQRPIDDLHELLRLRGEVGVLRDQSNEVLQLRAEVAKLRNEAAAGSPGLSHSQPGKKEVADIEYNFQGMPVAGISDIYGQLCGKKMIVDRNVNPAARIHLITPHKVTASGAILLLQNALEEQANVEIMTVDDDTLAVVPIPDPNAHMPRRVGRQP